MIDTLLEIQKPVMLFFQSIRVPAVSFIAEALSFLGESTWAVALILFIYLVLDKRTGFALATLNMTTHVANNTLKAIFRVPRPWVKFSDEIVPLRQSTATGYSFPSGHSAGAGSLYYGLYKTYKNKVVRVLCIALLILIPLSRIYLGVHWPLDVIVGLAIGIFISSFVENFRNVYDNLSTFRKLFLILSPILTFLALVDAVLIDLGILDSTLYKDLATSFIGLGAVYFASYLERRYINFTHKKGILMRALCYLLSFALGYLLTLFPLSNISVMPRLFKTLGLFLLIVWEIYLWPLIGVKIGVYRKEEENN